MRHRHKGKTLDRKAQPRNLMLRNLACSVLLYEQVTTTKAKARAVQSIVEKAITVGKAGSLTARRRLVEVLPTKNAVAKVLEELAPKYSTRTGGYSRIVNLGRRQGDAAEMVRIELIN